MQESSVNVYHDMNWLPLDLRRQLHLSTYMYKIINGISHSQFVDLEMAKAVIYILISRNHINGFYILELQILEFITTSPLPSWICKNFFKLV